jgi:hypothetical protein
MLSVNRRLIRALTIVTAMSSPAALGVGTFVDPSAQVTQPPANDRAKFVGTFALVSSDVRDPANGRWSQAPGFNSNGYVTYSDGGYMGLHIMPKHRAMFRSSQPTGEEAQAALRGYSAYFGTYTVNEIDGSVVHHRVGQLNLSDAPDAKRFYEFDDDRLILLPSDGGTREKATRRNVFQRMPEAPLSAAARNFVGFYKLLYQDSFRTKDGQVVFHGDRVDTRAETSYMIYTPSGHMMFHQMDREGRTRYAAREPTPDEALRAYRSYSGYFGRFVTYENHTPPFVYHSQLGTITPSAYSEQRRYYEIAGNLLTLSVPPTVPDAAGELTGGRHAHWERLPPLR